MRIRRRCRPSLAASMMLVFASVACSEVAVGLKAQDTGSAGSSEAAGSPPFPPDPPAHHDVAPMVQQAARDHLAGRFGGFWVEGAVMVIAVVGEPTAEDRAIVEREAQGLPHRFVTVGTPHSRLQQVVDELPAAPLWDQLSMAGVDVPRNRVSVGVSTRGAVDGVRQALRRAYPDVEFLVEFTTPLQTVPG